MSTIDNRHPSVIYIEKVCKKASEEGFQLNIGNNQMGMPQYVWKSKDGKTFGDSFGQMVVNDNGQQTNLTVQTLMLEACIRLENEQGWNVLTEELTEETKP